MVNTDPYKYENKFELPHEEFIKILKELHPVNNTFYRGMTLYFVLCIIAFLLGWRGDVWLYLIILLSAKFMGLYCLWKVGKATKTIYRKYGVKYNKGFNL